MRRLMISMMAAALILPVLPPGGAAGHPGQRGETAMALAAAATGTSVCTLRDDRLVEISGLVAVDDGYVAVNDSSDVDDRRRIFFLDRSCAVNRTVRYPSRPRDTEDLARAPDGTLWVGDIGDNDRSRETVALWRLAPSGKTPVLHRLRYPDGAHDAEALLLSGDGTPIIVTKDDAGTPGLYSPTRPLRAGATVPMRRVGEFTLPRSSTRNPFSIFGRRLVTGGGVAPDGRRVVLRTYADALEFDVTDGDVARAITEGVPRITPLPDEPQGESITYSTDGRSLLTVSEATGSSSGARPVILSYPVSGSAPKPSSTPGNSPGGTGPDQDRAAESRRDDTSQLLGATVAVGLLLTTATVFGVRRARRRSGGR